MWKATSALLLGLLLPQDVPESASTVLARTDTSAIFRTWKIKGAMTCHYHGRPRACLVVENAYPCGIFEVVQRPGASQVVEAAPALQGIRGGARHGEGNLRFAETRVHTDIPWPTVSFPIPIASPGARGFMTNYVSEMDGLGWRTDWWDWLLAASRFPTNCEANPGQEGCAGTWGAFYPRSGFVIQPSEPRAAFLQAVRAGRVACSPSGRVVLAQYAFEPRRGHYLQMIRPVPKPAVPIGYPGPIDLGAGSTTGGYLFLHLGIFEECRRCMAPRLVGAR